MQNYLRAASADQRNDLFYPRDTYRDYFFPDEEIDLFRVYFEEGLESLLSKKDAKNLSVLMKPGAFERMRFLLYPA